MYRSQDNSDRPPATVYEHLGYGPRSEGKRRRGQTASRRGLGQQWPDTGRAKGRQGRGHSVQGRASEFEGAARGERSLCQGSGEQECGRGRGRGLTERGRPRAFAGTKGRSGWAGMRTKSGRGRAGPGPSPKRKGGPGGQSKNWSQDLTLAGESRRAMRAGRGWDRSPAGRGSQSGREGEVGVGGAEGRGLPQRGRGCVSRAPGRAGRGGSASPPALWASRRWGRDTPEPRPRARSAPGSDPGALRKSLARGAALSSRPPCATSAWARSRWSSG